MIEVPLTPAEAIAELNRLAARVARLESLLRELDTSLDTAGASRPDGDRVTKTAWIQEAIRAALAEKEEK